MIDWLNSLNVIQIGIIVLIVIILLIPRRILFTIIFIGALITVIYFNIDFSKYINTYKSEIIMFSIILIFVLVYVKIKSIHYEMKLADEKIKNKDYEKKIIEDKENHKNEKNILQEEIKQLKKNFYKKNEKTKSEDVETKSPLDNIKIDTEIYTYQVKIKELEKALSLSQMELMKQKLIIDDEKISLKNQIKELEKKLPKVYSKEEIENMKKAGDNFEIEVGKYFENAGFSVEYRGLELGVLDGGIDLIAKKDKTIFLIQCKYWKKKDSITHNMIKEFYGNCNFYIDKHNLDRNHIVCIYVIANVNSLHFQAYNIFKEHYQKCRFLLLSEEQNTSLKELLEFKI